MLCLSLEVLRCPSVPDFVRVVDLSGFRNGVKISTVNAKMSANLSKCSYGVG